MPGQNKNIKLSVEFSKFSESKEKQGCFEGILVNYNHDNLAHGIFKFAKGSMKANEGKTMLLLYNHRGDNIPVGTCAGYDSEQGFMIKAQLQLTKDDNGNTINKEAFALYDLMKNQDAKFELSAGGTIDEWVEQSKDGKKFYEIKKFNAYEGSITPAGAVQGSTVTQVFNDDRGEENMNFEEQQKFIAKIIAKMKEELFSAQEDKELKELPEKIAALEAKFSKEKETLANEIKESFEEQFKEINNVIKGLKANFKPSTAEVTFADEFMAAFNSIVANGGKMMQVTQETVLKFAAKGGTTVSEGTKAAVKAHQLLGILKRLQEVNPVVSDLNIISISDNSLDLDREEVGLPEVAWIGETDTRVDTEITELEDVQINMHQIYAMPKISNKLMASNYVGYVAFLMNRVEYAWALKIANTMFAGSGNKQPLGILNDSGIKNIIEWDLSSMTDEQKVDAIVSAYGNTRDEIASNSKWYMRRETWVSLTLLKDKDGRLKLINLKDGGDRKLLGRQVVIIDSEKSGLKKISEAAAGEPIIVFADVKHGMLGITNPKLNLKINDNVTMKGWTAYYMEKGLGFGVVLPENFTIIKNKA